MMERRTFLGTLAGGLLATTLVAEAQQARVYRVGVILLGGPELAPRARATPRRRHAGAAGGTQATNGELAAYWTKVPLESAIQAARVKATK
jgi:hypothetical protein